MINTSIIRAVLILLSASGINNSIPLCENAEYLAECDGFIERRIKPDSKEYRQLQIIKDAYQIIPSSPLPLAEAAAVSGFTELLQVLLYYGIPINKKYSMEETVSHIAAGHGYDDMVTFLLTQGANIQAKDWVGYTPLHAAVGHIESKTAKLLLDAGADVNAANMFKETPIFLVIEHLTPFKIIFRVFNNEQIAEYKNRRKDIIEMLLEHGADTNIANYRRMTPLHIAAKNSNVTIVQLLIEAGANINATDYNNQTPLHKATESNNLSVVEYLIGIGCDKTVIDSDKKTALDIAKEKNLTEIVDLLSIEI